MIEIFVPDTLVQHAGYKASGRAMRMEGRYPELTAVYEIRDGFYRICEKFDDRDIRISYMKSDGKFLMYTFLWP